MRRPPGPGGTLGVSLVEALVGLLLTALLVQTAWSIAASARRTARRVMERSEALETERVGWHVLSREVGAGLHGRDWSLEGPRVLPLRAFRGLAEVCPELADADGAVVRYRGMRLPEPAKDSLLVLSASGEWHAVELVGRTADGPGCPAWPVEGGEGWRVERWRWEPSVRGALLARVYERGSYHLEDRAVRYRTGDGGRQPLTAERLDGTGSAFTVDAGALELRLRVRAEAGTLWETTRRLPSGGEEPDD